MNWYAIYDIVSLNFDCGYCDNRVASSKGVVCKNSAGQDEWFIRMCPHCDRPTFFQTPSNRYPNSKPGQSVDFLPKQINELYNEARRCIASSCYTSSVLACRKLLAHIAVEKGAKPGLSFIKYVEYLAANNYVPPGGGEWVDHIRTKGNEANHEIVLMDSADAKELVMFSEMLLKFIFEFPARIPKPPPPVAE